MVDSLPLRAYSARKISQIPSMSFASGSTRIVVFQAWEEDPLDTLKLIAHMRDVRDGKADRDLFHYCMAWLWQEHPLTLLANLDEVVKVGTIQQGRDSCPIVLLWACTLFLSMMTHATSVIIAVSHL